MAKKTVEELKRVCKECSPFRNLEGKIKMCKHLEKNDLCSLPGRFECTVKSYLDRMESEDHTSYSQSSTFLSCPLKYYFSYIAKIPLDTKPSWMWLGNTFHEGAANIDLGRRWDIGEIPENSAATKFEAKAVKAVLEWYADNKHLFAQAIECESKIDFRTPKGRLVIGYIDAISQESSSSRRIMRERKYSVMDYSELVERRQVSMYFAGDPEATEVHIEVFAKPKLRPKKGETTYEFESRVQAWVKKKAEEGTMVKISRYNRGSFPVESEVAAIDQIMDMRDKCIETGIWPGAYSPFMCPMCVHKNHCRNCSA